MSEIAEEIRKALETDKLSMWDLQANAPTWLRWQQGEIERLTKENAYHERRMKDNHDQALENAVIIDQLREELAEEKRHAELGWEQSNKWLEENGRLRAELDQVKKEIAEKDKRLVYANQEIETSINLLQEDYFENWDEVVGILKAARRVIWKGDTTDEK